MINFDFILHVLWQLPVIIALPWILLCSDDNDLKALYVYYLKGKKFSENYQSSPLYPSTYKKESEHMSWNTFTSFPNV